MLACGLSTFFKYADLVGYQKLKKKKSKHRPPRPREASLNLSAAWARVGKDVVGWGYELTYYCSPPS